MLKDMETLNLSVYSQYKFRSMMIQDSNAVELS